MKHTGIRLFFGSAAGFVDKSIHFPSLRELNDLLRGSRLDEPVIVD